MSYRHNFLVYLGEQFGAGQNSTGGVGQNIIIKY